MEYEPWFELRLNDRASTVVLVSERDREFVESRKWHVVAGTGYVATLALPEKKRLYLHRALMDLKKNSGLSVKFLNGDKLDNRRENLQVIPAGEVPKRGAMRRNNTSGYRGVSRAPSGRWSVDIRAPGTRYRLGVFDTPEEAARAYDAKARELGRHPSQFNFSDGAGQDDCSSGTLDSVENDKKRINNAVRLGAFLFLGGADQQDGQLIASLFAQPDVVAMANYAIAAPAVVFPLVSETVAVSLSSKLGGETEFWQALMTTFREAGKTIFIPTGNGHAELPATAAPADPPSGLSRMQQLDMEYMRKVAPLREKLNGLRAEGMSVAAIHQKMKELADGLPVLSYSQFGSISSENLRGTAPRAISPESYNTTNTLLDRVIASRQQPAPAPAPQEPAQRVRVDPIPTDHQGRIKAAYAFATRKDGKFTLSELGKAIGLDDDEKVYAVLRDVPGVRRVDGSTFQYVQR